MLSYNFVICRFQTDKRTLPVLWHQSLLTFAQRYKDSISTEQREALMSLLKAKRHPSITDEIRRELASAKCRDEPAPMEQTSGPSQSGPIQDME